MLLVSAQAVSVFNAFWTALSGTKTKACATLVTLASLACLVWAFVIWVNQLGGDGSACRVYWEDAYGKLYFFFVFIFWYQVAAMCLIGLGVVGACVIACAK